MDNKKYADSLRLVADWFEAHLEVEPPHDADTIGLYNVSTREDMERVARAFGSCEKEYSEGYFKLHKKIGDITISAVAGRQQVCKKHIVGTKIIPEKVITVPSHVEEIVEWECFETPLLRVPEESVGSEPTHDNVPF